MSLEKNVQSPTSELTSQIVRAGAGAGKTTKLTEQIFVVAKNFKKETGHWPKLVVTTFTRKATQELRERLVVKACQSSDSELLKYLSSSNIYISTIHGVLSLFMRRYGHLLGWDNSFEVMGNADSLLLAKEVLLDIAIEEEWSNLHQKFEFSHLCQLMLAFYERHLAEDEPHFCIKSDFEKLHHTYLLELGDKFVELANLMNSVGLPKWSEYAQHMVALSETFKVAELSEPISGAQVLAQIKELGSRPRKTKEVPEETSEEVKELFDKIKADLSEDHLKPELWPEFLTVYASFAKLAKLFVQKFVEKKQVNATIEMRDLELMVAKIIRTEPALVGAFSSEWDYWLIDEFQDTSPLQNKILRKFISEKPVFIVGDPQQSIYLFRGARSEVFAQKENELKDHHSELMVNYRSDPDLLHFINTYFSKFKQKFKAMQSKPSPNKSKPHRVVAEFFIEPIEKKFTKNKAEPDTNLDESNPSYLDGNSNLCLEYLRRRIIKLINTGERAEQICILSRKNSHLLEAANYLSIEHIPTHVHASSGFFERREVLDATAILQFFLNPHDNENLISMLRSPWFGVSDYSLYKYSQSAKAQKLSLWLASVNEPNTYADFETAREVLRAHYLRYQEMGVCIAFELAINELGLIDYSHYHDSTGRRESNLWKVVNLLREAEKSPGFNLSQFLWRRGLDLSESESSGETDAVASLEPDAINLMTIHASKGLQFNHVFLLDAGKKPDLSGGVQGLDHVHLEPILGRLSFRCPVGVEGKLTKSIADQSFLKEMQLREIEEHDRLAYVALTRAKKNIYICSRGEAKKGSWLERSRFDLSEGVHGESNFSYKVLRELPSPVKLSQKLKKDSGQRSVFEPIITNQRLAKYSVSQILEDLEFSTSPEPNKTGVSSKDSANSSAGTNTDTDSNTGTGRNTNTDANTNVDRNASANTDINANACTDVSTNASIDRNTDFNFFTKTSNRDNFFDKVSIEKLGKVGVEVARSTLQPNAQNSVLLKRLQAVSDGVNLHGLFESLHYNPNLDIDDYLKLNFRGDGARAKAAVHWALNLETPPLKKIIEIGEVEWGFQIATPRGLVEGQIDLWGVVDDVCWVVDYKSGNIKYKDKAFQQLQLYSLALLELGYQNINLVVVYPNSQKVEVAKFKASFAEVIEKLKLTNTPDL